MAYIENWLGKAGGANGLTGYATTPDQRQHLFVAGPDGFVRPLEIGPPHWQWVWGEPIMQYHEGIVGLAAFYHPGDGHQHLFAALQTGDIWEALFLGDRSSPDQRENWLGKLVVGAVSLAGYSTTDGTQHLLVAGPDGLVRPLEIGPGSNWQWTWRDPVMSHHDEIVGLAAYYHPGDDRQHVFAALRTGDIWEAVLGSGKERTENWLGKLDGGAIAIAGHSAPNGTQHLFVATPKGPILPLQIGPPHWKWRWGNPVMSHHDEIVGLAAYYHPGDDRQHVFAALRTGDIWESRSPLPAAIQLDEWNPKVFPISYWWGPPSDDAARAQYQQIVDAGFTFAMFGSPYTVDANLKLLDAAGAVGLRAFIRDYRIDQVVTIAALDDSAQHALDAVIADYSGHSALAGYYLADEPHDDRFPLLAAMVAYLRAADPGHGCFIDSRPIYDGFADVADYEKYVDEYIKTVKPFAVCYDHYPFLSGGDRPDFFRNLHIVRSHSVASGLPFWQIVLAMPHSIPGLSYRSPTAAEKRFEVMQTLAFGGSGVLYFTYWVPSEFVGPAIVNRDGTPSPHYEEVRHINADARAIGRYLLRAQSTMVFENGTLPDGGSPPPPNAPVQLLSAVDITVGVFLNAPYTYALLANRDYRNTTSSDAIFTAQAVQWFDKTNGGWADVDTSLETHIVLAAGDAELYRLI